MHSAKSLISTKKNSFNKYLSLPPRCGKWIEAQAAQYITTLATRQVLTSSEPNSCLTASQELCYKQSTRSILKSSANMACQTPRRSKRKDKRSTRSCSPVTFSSKDEDKDKDTSPTLRNHQKTHSPTREQKERPRPWKKRLDKSSTVDHIGHCGGHWKRRREGTVVSSVQDWSPFILKGSQNLAFQLKG